MPADEHDIELLRAAAADKANQRVLVHVTGCAYSCCGRGWVRKDGYEQAYAGWIDNLEIPSAEQQRRGMVGTFMLYSPGLGKLTYVVAVRFTEVEMVEAL